MVARGPVLAVHLLDRLRLRFGLGARAELVIVLWRSSDARPLVGRVDYVLLVEGTVPAR